MLRAVKGRPPLPKRGRGEISGGIEKVKIKSTLGLYKKHLCASPLSLHECTVECHTPITLLNLIKICKQYTLPFLATFRIAKYFGNAGD